MKSLSSYLKSHSNGFTVNGTSSKKLLIFDIDDTLINTTAEILVRRSGRVIKRLSNSDFNDYSLNAGEEFDFSEFNDPKILNKETFTKYWDTLKREYNKGTHIAILTAREDKDMILKFFLKNGIDIKPSLVFAVGDPKLGLKGSIQRRKSKIIEYYIKLGYDTLVFFDDNENNLKFTKELEMKFNVKIHTVHV